MHAVTAPAESQDLLATPPALVDFDLARCEALMRGGSKSFFAASLVLPRRVRCAATALYAFCRVADDAVDLHADKAGAMRQLRGRLARLYEGRPDAIEADRAMAHVCALHRIPMALPAALLEGFEWDAQGRQYETLPQLQDYAARVAGTVGAMMALIMGSHSSQALARACELGVAMQLTNIARDVGEDARAGRLYLPRQWLREAGLDPDAWLAAPQFNAAIRGVVQRLLLAADALYDRAEAGVAELPRDCRPAIQAARLVYAEIGREIERAGGDSVNQRAVVSGQRKLALMARAFGAVVQAGPAPGPQPPLPAVAGLVEVCLRSLRAAAPRPTPVAPAPATTAAPELATSLKPRGSSFYARTVWVIELCERTEQRRRVATDEGARQGWQLR